MPDQEAATVTKTVVNEMFCRFGPPLQLHSDQGRQFEAELISHVCKLLHIHKSRTTPYHPQSDGFIERYNRTLLSMLSTWSQTHSSEWDKDLKALGLAYNTSVQETTGFTPFFLMFGREVRMPVDLVYGLPPNTDSESVSHLAYVQQLQENLEASYSFVRLHVSNRQLYQKTYYDRKVHECHVYRKDDLVWLHNPAVPKGCSRKFHRPWTGPFVICEKLSVVNYRIQHLRSRKKQIVHFNRLKPCPRNIRLTSPLPSNDRSHPVHRNDCVINESPAIGINLELVDDDDLAPAAHIPEPNRRYPTRTRRPPDCLSY